MNNPLKDLYRRVFIQGQETVAKEVSVELFQEQVTAMHRAGQIAGEAIDLADQLGADGDPYKRQIADLLKAGVVESLGAMQQVASNKATVGEAKEALQNDPFSAGLLPSGTNLPSESEPSKALPHQSSEPPQAVEPSQKRGPGRPRKNPKPDQSS